MVSINKKRKIDNYFNSKKNNIKKIILIDIKSSGHHIDYAKIFLSGINKEYFKTILVGTKEFLDCFDNILFNQKQLLRLDLYKQKNKIYLLLNEILKYKFLKQIFKNISVNKSTIHFLYFDSFILIFIFVGIFHKLPMNNIIVSLHGVNFIERKPQRIYSRIKKNLILHFIKKFTKNGLKIIVHSEEIKDRLIKLLDNLNIIYLPYPIKIKKSSNTNFLKKREKIRKLFGLKNDTCLILLFGGTRYNKGLDLAIEALKLLPYNYKMLVVGKEEFFKKEFIIDLARKRNVLDRVLLFLDFIPEDKVIDYFISSDLILLPYRKGFFGQSGPLVIAGIIGIPIVASDQIVLKETINKYNLGVVFETENINDMASKLIEIEKRRKLKEARIFYKDYNIKNFQKKLINFY